MNREIKFRGKRLDDGEWLYGSLVGIDDTAFIINRDDIDWNPNTDIYAFWFDNQDCLVNSASVGQFTGLHDRTGKEVYEGDVVFWIAIDMQGRGKGEQGAIIWDKSTMAWAIMRDKPTSDGRPCIISRPFDKRHLEVVGNIHDNPELLKI